MKSKLRSIGLVLAILTFPVLAADSYAVKYSSGSLNAKAGKAMRLVISPESILVMDGTRELARTTPQSITDLTQGIEPAKRPNPGGVAATLGWSAVLSSTTPRRLVGFAWDGGMLEVEVRPADSRLIVKALQASTSRTAETVNVIGRK